jgi:hypothetical protein
MIEFQLADNFICKVEKISDLLSPVPSACAAIIMRCEDYKYQTYKPLNVKIKAIFLAGRGGQ